ncbi:MAG: esterase, partial [Acetobacteraceae bacterium]|nr:esterase [Acetobacteraceae bacterium]
MFENLQHGLGGAAKLIASGRLMDATAVIQRALGGSAAASEIANMNARRPAPIIDGLADAREAPTGRRPRERSRDFLGTVNLRDLVRPKLKVPSATVPMPEGAQFLAGEFANEAGSRPYKLYVPSGYHAGQKVPLVVMLHGCTQSPDDFALGTRMNEIAEQRNLLVVYPGQVGSANMQKCWNWYKEGDQRRDEGEPSLIAGITRKVI